ncbi:bifunctional diguanylate cyclase/phosphodiesterase [Marinomonas pollencensis]|uniref:Diguanylate cyclase/phosphodiesterase n=1 Tax=Marinomonas pollencensis TaxID=491954 RepID=A0A3E0DJZ1_9GAMM|nr:EAL domain-containing protein [Marinomonas pollencensis]REG82410.1 diguanylate cyclase/phosphodiesterase [Marinomonas pollencensis]
MLASFRSRLLALLLGMLAMVQLGTGVAVLSSLKEDNYKQGVQAIEVAKNVFDSSLDSRVDQLTKSVKILASDFGFKQAVATQEIGTIRSVLANHGARISADVSLLIAPDGKIVAATKELNIDQQVTQLVRSARRTGSASISTMISFSGQAYQLVLVPVKAPNIIAWVGMAFLLDKALAEQLKAVTGFEISFVGNPRDGNKLTGYSTLPEQDKAALFQQAQHLNSLAQQPTFTNNDKYLSLSINLAAKNQWGVLHLPYQPWLESYNRTRTQLLWIFTGGLAFALLVGIFLARNLTAPIERLVEFARQIGLVGSDAKAPAVTGEFGVLSNTMMAMQSSIALREEELTSRALHDLHTGLYNRNAVEQYLTKVLPRHNGCLVLVDIRHFKDLNNLLGFDHGDALLLGVTERLLGWGSGAVMQARIAGDQFLLVFDEEINGAQCHSLCACFEPAFIVDGSEVHLSVAVGVLPFEATILSANDAMRRLDITLDRSKEASASCAFYQTGQDESHQRQLRIIGDLTEALVSQQMFVVYQPKVSVAEKDCHEVEALVRWQHPELGFIPPDEFISLLEQAGNIQQLTQWVIETVLSQLQVWWRNGHQIRAAINLSVHDLVNEQLPAYIAQALEDKALPVTALALEVTESAVMKDRNKVIQVLNGLQSLGIHLAIDDFGTGQSSLAYLRELPVNEVKIDRAFIQFIDTNKGDEFIVKASIEMSHSLGLQVTAEGAENASGVALLEHYQCDKIQGYYFSKPLISEDFLRWLDDFRKV